MRWSDCLKIEATKSSKFNITSLQILVPSIGTMLFYKPGLLAGGPVEHDCSPQRSIGYYLEAVILLAPFCKKPIRLNLKGVTNDRYDPTVCEVTNMYKVDGYCF